jgi:hypothetical protein
MAKREAEIHQPKAEAQEAYKQRINAISNATLVQTTKSTYMGGVVSGKAYEQVNYLAGLLAYLHEIKAAWMDGSDSIL